MKNIFSEKANMFYLNSGFDLELSKTNSHHLHGVISQMTHWFIPVLEPRDHVLVDLPVPEEFLCYLRKTGLEPAQVTEQNGPSGISGQAWGWTESSVKRLAGAGAELIYPPLQVVKNVNSRAFCFKLGREHDLGTPGAYLELDPSKVLEDGFCSAGPMVLKTMHSNAGRGMLVRRADGWSSRQIANIKKIHDSGQILVVEPWLSRIGDISTRFDLSADGKASNICHYWSLIGPDGHCAGDFLCSGTEDFERWGESLDRAVDVASRALAASGYFGPVGLDHFLYRHGREVKLAAMVDINARHTLGTLAVALRKKLNEHRPLLLRLISKKKHRLPADYDGLRQLLGDLWWNRKNSSGVILLTALRVQSGGSLVQPARSLFCLQAQSRESLKEVYMQLLERLGHKLDRRLPFEPMGIDGSPQNTIVI